jgi:hypothetical protein
MKKLRIELGDLRVESFATSIDVSPQPTRSIRAHAATIGEPWQSWCNCPIGWSWASCPDVTCACSVEVPCG